MAILGFQVNFYRTKWLDSRRAAVEEETCAAEREYKLMSDTIAREKEMVDLMRDSGGCLKPADLEL